MDKDPFFDGLRANAQFQKLRQAGIACYRDFLNNREKSRTGQIDSRIENGLTAR